jgi:two-component system LytT family response regulator
VIIKSVVEGRKLLAKANCDIVFMDVEIEGGLAFEILELLPEKDFHLIFNTDKDAYALRAIKYNAIDYLLKPCSPDDVVKAILKVRKRIAHIQDNQWINEENKLKRGFGKRIKLITKEGIEIVREDEIIYCEANGAYCIVYLSSNSKIMLSKPLKELEGKIEFYNFERIHSSYLVNMKHIRKYIKSEGGWVHLSDGTELPVSRRKRQEFLDSL